MLRPLQHITLACRYSPLRTPSIRTQHIDLATSRLSRFRHSSITTTAAPAAATGTETETTMEGDTDILQNYEHVEASMREMQMRTLSMYRRVCKEAYKFVSYFDNFESSPKVMKLIPGDRIYSAVRSQFRSALSVNGRQLRRAWEEYRLLLEQQQHRQGREEEEEEMATLLSEQCRAMGQLLQGTVQRMNDELTDHTYYLMCAVARTYRECLLHNRRNKRKRIDNSIRMHILKLFSEEQMGNDAYKRSLMDAMVDLEKMEWEAKRWKKMRSALEQIMDMEEGEAMEEDIDDVAEEDVAEEDVDEEESVVNDKSGKKTKRQQSVSKKKRKKKSKR